ncbi:MAG: hypothetical protein AAGD04_17200 [Pseudomonadota bacterium]
MALPQPLSPKAPSLASGPPTGRFDSFDDFAAKLPSCLAPGPIAVIFVEDSIEVNSTISHHLGLGFGTIVVLAPEDLEIEVRLSEKVIRITYRAVQSPDFADFLNKIIAKAPKRWIYYCFNAEYLYYPFCETRRIGEMLAFHAEERRAAMLTYVIDIYAENLHHYPNAVDRQSAHLDKSGYYALNREDPNKEWAAKDRQMDFFGGLRWRFEEHVPWEKRRIDRIGIFQSKPGLKVLADHRLSIEEMNTYACPWHNNLTAAICSFRTAKALKRNPGSTFDIQTFKWHNSTPFHWTSQQLMDLGLMEPGQWF